ncbi:MAG: hypothetical protein JWP86_2093 [Phenylobacterium sp.]|nr:hypothetical protein [Phenylobacterium sp.]
MERPVLIRALLASFFLMAGATAQAMPLRLGDLIGSSVVQVQARFAADRAAPSDSLTAAAGTDEPIRLVGLDDLAGVNGADGHCISAAGAWWPSSSPVLVFRAGVLVGAVTPAPLREQAMPRDFRAAAYMRSPLKNPVIAHSGDLPLEDGLSALTERLGPSLPPDTVLNPCIGPARGQGSGSTTPDLAGALQGAMIAPLAAKLPALNATRARARLEGPKALAQLRLGEVLEGGPQRFVAEHPGSFVEQHGVAYEILVIDLGDEPGRNVARMNEAAFVGLRGGRIEWMAPSSRRAIGKFIALGLCEDEGGRPSNKRRGCTGYGFFSP